MASGDADRSPPASERSRWTEAVDAYGRPYAAIKGFGLKVIEGPDKGRVLRSARERSVIGCHESADLVLSDRAASRFHFELRLEPDAVVLRDLGSRNGTYIDGVAVEVAPLTGSAKIAAGRTTIRFDPTGETRIALSPQQRFGLVRGRSIGMRALFSMLERAAPTDATILLEGETGTGKELLAESIHRESGRASGPLVVVDCGAIPATLLETELFGHERGAFTGAEARRPGAFHRAQGGTLFLDEIGELSRDLQPKLLRALERRMVKRVGGDQWERLDVRIVAASNRDLRAEVNARRFRADLFYRLSVIHVRVPPLRERREDLPLLVEDLAADLGAAGAPEAGGLLEESFLDELGRHAWPGNVRELRNYLETYLVARTPPRPGEPVETDPLSAALREPLTAAREEWTRQLEQRYLEEVMRRHDGNVSAAARAAGVDRRYFYRLLAKHGFR